MQYIKERNLLLDYSHTLEKSQDLTRGTSGNLSVFNQDDECMIITPSGVPYSELTPDKMVVLDRKGKALFDGLKPSSEFGMHLAIYNARSDIHSIVHTHPVFISVLACLNESLPALHYMIAAAGGEVECAPYAGYGTKELAQNSVDYLKNKKAVILANHGLLTAGKNIQEAWAITEELEYLAKVYVHARQIGSPIILPQEEIDNMVERFKDYGNVPK